MTRSGLEDEDIMASFLQDLARMLHKATTCRQVRLKMALHTFTNPGIKDVKCEDVVKCQTMREGLKAPPAHG
eukprot:1526828-Amphidinium_carterae.1